MWGLAYKDLLLMRRSLWYYAFLLVIRYLKHRGEENGKEGPGT